MFSWELALFKVLQDVSVAQSCNAKRVFFFERAVNYERFGLDCSNKLLDTSRWSSVMNRVVFFHVMRFLCDNSMKVIYFSALVGQHKKH